MGVVDPGIVKTAKAQREQVAAIRVRTLTVLPPCSSWQRYDVSSPSMTIGFTMRYTPSPPPPSPSPALLMSAIGVRRVAKEIRLVLLSSPVGVLDASGACDLGLPESDRRVRRRVAALACVRGGVRLLSQRVEELGCACVQAAKLRRAAQVTCPKCRPSSMQLYARGQVADFSISLRDAVTL